LDFFFIPNPGFVYYGYFALGGSFLFIIIQLVLLIDMAHSWSESWIMNYEKSESKFWAFALMAVSVLFYLLSITGTVLMYVYYTKESPGCWVNSMFITLNLAFCFIITCLSVHPKVQEKNPKSGLLQSATVTIYSTYLVYSSIVSEPRDMNCTQSTDPNSPVSIIMLILGVLFTFIAIIYSAISTATTSNQVGETTGLIKEEKDPKDEENDKEEKDIETASPAVQEKVSYNYCFFHVTFALAVMYLCMVLTNWMLVSEGNNIFNTVPSISPSWVKITSSWITLILYIWTLIAPLLLKNRVFNRE